MGARLRHLIRDLFREERPEPPIFEAETNQPFVLPAHIAFSGDMAIDGDIVITHFQEGLVEASRLYLAPGATFEGTLIADTVEIAGDLTGTIYADTILIRPTAAIEGELVFKEISIETGAWFEGKTQRVSDARAMADDIPRRVGVLEETTAADRVA